MEKYELRKHEYFDFVQAKTYTRYSLWIWKKGLFGKWKWRRLKEEHYVGFGDIHKSPVTGDLAWAKRIAKHLGIEVPK